MLTSSAVRSTFDSSSAPACSTPRLPEPGTPTIASPEAALRTQPLPPIGCRPCGLRKVASSSWPAGFVWPFEYWALMMPSLSIWTPMSWPAVYPFWDRLVTPNWEPYSVAPERSSETPEIGTVVAPLALVTAGMFSVTAPTGAVGVPPLVGKVIVVVGDGLPPEVVSGTPLAAT